MLTVFLYQKGSPESRRPYAVEEYDADPRRFSHLPDVPWPVRGGVVLSIYRSSLGLAFVMLFAASWTGHAIAGWCASIRLKRCSRDAARLGSAAGPLGALLVRVAAELAERVSRHRRDGLARRLSPPPQFCK